MTTLFHIAARWPRHASSAVATGLMVLAATTCHSQCFRSRKNFQKRINRSSSITKRLSLRVTIEKHQVLEEPSPSQRRAVVCGPVGMTLHLHCSRQSINLQPSSHSIHLQVHRPLTFEDLSPLYQRTAPTELCLLISQKQIEDRLIPFLRTPDGASAFTSLLRSDRWKSLLTGNAEIKDVAEKLIVAFFDSIQQQHFLTVQHIPLLMHTAPAVVEPIPYTLIFATRRQDSLLCMNDAICIYHRRLYEQSLEGVLTEAWFSAQQHERLADGMQQLYQRVLQQGRAQRQRRWPDLRQQSLLANFGQFTLHDYDSVIQRLLQSGEVRCEWRQKSVESPQSDEQRYPWKRRYFTLVKKEAY